MFVLDFLYKAKIGKFAKQTNNLFFESLKKLEK